MGADPACACLSAIGTRTAPSDQACALAADTLTLKRPLSDLANQAYALTLAEMALMRQTASPRMPIPPPV